MEQKHGHGPRQRSTDQQQLLRSDCLRSIEEEIRSERKRHRHIVENFQINALEEKFINKIIRW
jgi:hypothetical protein